MDTYLPTKIAEYQNTVHSNQTIIYESIKLYLKSLDNEINIIKDELSILDVEYKFKVKKYDNISKEIKNLNELVEINENNKKLVLEYIDNEILRTSH